MSNPMPAINELSDAEVDKLDEIQISLARIRHEIEELGEHRNYSMAITKIEEAEHWLHGRKSTTP